MGSPRSFAHQALVYSSQEEFLAAVVPFIQAGLPSGERVFVMTDRGKAAALRDALGEEAAAVSFGDHRVWFQRPARRLNECYRLSCLWQRVGVGRIRVIGEPAWSGCSEAQIREWKRFEALVNLVYARFPILVLCPYGAQTLPPSIMADACCTHPELLVGSKIEKSTGFVDPAAFIAEIDRQGLEEPEGPWEELSFRGDLDELRGFVVDRATRAGVAATRLAELEWGANEIATNVIRHAGGEATVRVWSTPGEFVCEIADQATGIKDPLVGRLPPEAGQNPAPGLWLVHQLCDLVEFHSSSGLTVRLHIVLERSSHPDSEEPQTPLQASPCHWSSLSRLGMWPSTMRPAGAEEG